MMPFITLTDGIKCVCLLQEHLLESLSV